MSNQTIYLYYPSNLILSATIISSLMLSQNHHIILTLFNQQTLSNSSHRERDVQSVEEVLQSVEEVLGPMVGELVAPHCPRDHAELAHLPACRVVFFTVLRRSTTLLLVLHCYYKQRTSFLRRTDWLGWFTASVARSFMLQQPCKRQRLPRGIEHSVAKHMMP